MQKKEGKKKEGRRNGSIKEGREEEISEKSEGDVLSHKILVTLRTMYRAALETTR